MKPRSRAKFKVWVTRNGGEWLVGCPGYQWARFRTDDGLCIIYRNGLGDVSSFVGKGCREAWDAFQAKRELPLSTPPIAVASPDDHWQVRGKRIAAALAAERSEP